MSWGEHAKISGRTPNYGGCSQWRKAAGPTMPKTKKNKRAAGLLYHQQTLRKQMIGFKVDTSMISCYEDLGEFPPGNSLSSDG